MVAKVSNVSLSPNQDISFSNRLSLLAFVVGSVAVNPSSACLNLFWLLVALFEPRIGRFVREPGSAGPHTSDTIPVSLQATRQQKHAGNSARGGRSRCRRANDICKHSWSCFCLTGLLCHRRAPHTPGENTPGSSPRLHIVLFIFVFAFQAISSK